MSHTSAQSSWILSATVKDNIVFWHRFDPVFYDQVLDACALRSDLAVLPQGHMTEVGEKGVSLSGGQKARNLPCASLLCPRGHIPLGTIR